jgi:hypothetical protein
VIHGWVSKHLIADTLGSLFGKDYCGQTKIKIDFNITVIESIFLKHNLKFGKCFFNGIHGRK